MSEKEGASCSLDTQPTSTDLRSIHTPRPVDHENELALVVIESELRTQRHQSGVRGPILQPNPVTTASPTTHSNTHRTLLDAHPRLVRVLTGYQNHQVPGLQSPPPPLDNLQKWFRYTSLGLPGARVTLATRGSESFLSQAILSTDVTSTIAVRILACSSNRRPSPLSLSIALGPCATAVLPIGVYRGITLVGKRNRTASPSACNRVISVTCASFRNNLHLRNVTDLDLHHLSWCHAPNVESEKCKFLVRSLFGSFSNSLEDVILCLAQQGCSITFVRK